MMQREKQEVRLVPCVKSPLQTSLRLFVCQRLSIYLLFSIYPINNATISDSIFQIHAFQKGLVSKFRTQYHSLFPTSIMYTHIIHSFEYQLGFFDVSLTVHHSIDLFHLPTLMHNSIFINSMYVTLLYSKCFEHEHAHLQEDKLYSHSIWYRRCL